MHPTNLHVSEALFPNDTVQSKMPDPDWLENWLNTQIKFDKGWEDKVVTAILRKLSGLFEISLDCAKDLRMYRKQLATA